MKDIAKFFRRFLPYMKGHKLLFCVVIIGTVMTSAATAWSTYLVKPVLDDIFVNKNEHMLKVVPCLLILAYFFKSFGNYIQNYAVNYIGQDIVRQLRLEVLRHMLSLELDFFNKMRTGELISRISNDISIIRQAVSSYVTENLRDSLTIIGLVTVVIYQNPRLAIIGLVLIPLSMIPVYFLINTIKRYSRKSQEKNADITSHLGEIFHNIELIKVSDGEKIEAQEFEKEDLKFFKINVKAAYVNNSINPIMEFLGAVAIGGVIYLGGVEVIHDRMTTGAFFSFMTALFMLYTPVKKLVANYGNIQGALIASDRIFEILGRKSAIDSGHIDLEKPIVRLEYSHVSLYYDDLLALDDVSFHARRGEILALVGESGAGKSSVVNLLLRLYTPYAGHIYLDDVDLNDISNTSLREQVGIVTQRIFIFNDTVAANIAYGLEIDEQRVQRALKLASAYDFVARMEHGIHTVLHEFGYNLSGGQRQRIAIARALYRNPSILVLDEATSALDENTEDIIKEAIARFRHDKIIILIAHRPSTLALADTILRLDNGKIVAVEKGVENSAKSSGVKVAEKGAKKVVEKPQDSMSDDTDMKQKEGAK